MKLTLEAGEREILRASLGVADDASDAEIAAVIRDRLTGDPAATAGTLNTVERDATIAAAVRDGRFSADRAEHYRQQWDRDPEGTRRTVARLAPGVVQLAAGEGAPDSFPAEWLRAAPAVGERRTHWGGD